MACSHAVCRISSVMAAIFTSSLRQTRSRRSCPRRCSLRRSSVRRSITRRSTTRRPCTPLPLSIACSSSRRHSAVRALKKRRICAAVRPDIRLSVASNASGGGRRFEDFDGKGSCCLVVGSLAATPTFQNHKRTTAGSACLASGVLRQVHGPLRGTVCQHRRVRPRSDGSRPHVHGFTKLLTAAPLRSGIATILLAAPPMRAARTAQRCLTRGARREVAARVLYTWPRLPSP
jgi:hypothetical protein